MHIYLSITSFAGLQPLTLNASSEVSKWKRCYMASDMWSLGATFFEVIFWEPQGISGGWWARAGPQFGGWHIYWVLGGWTENIHRDPPCLDDEKSTLQQFKAEFGLRRMVNKGPLLVKSIYNCLLGDLEMEHAPSTPLSNSENHFINE